MILGENANAGATGSLRLAEGVSLDLWRKMAAWCDARDTFVVVPRVRPSVKPAAAGILDDAWIGQLRSASGDSSFEMITPAGLWFSPEQLGPRFTADQTLSSASLASHLGTLAPQGFVNATSATHSGNWSGDVRAGISYRNAWAAIAAEQGVAWRLDRQGRPVWGAEADVFDDPTTVISDHHTPVREGGAFDLLAGSPTSYVRDSSQLSKGTVSIGAEGVTGRIKVSTGADVVKFPNGAAVNPMRTLDLSGVENETTRQNLTDASKSRFIASAQPRIVMDVTVSGGEGYPLMSRLRAGDRIFVTSKRYGITDPAEQFMSVGGREFVPRRFQIRSIEWSPAKPAPMIWRPGESDPWADWDLLFDRVEVGSGYGTLTVDSDLTPYQDPTDIGIPESPSVPLRTTPATSSISSTSPYSREGVELVAAGISDGLTRDVTTPQFSAAGFGGGFVRGT